MASKAPAGHQPRSKAGAAEHSETEIAEYLKGEREAEEAREEEEWEVAQTEGAKEATGEEESGWSVAGAGEDEEEAEASKKKGSESSESEAEKKGESSSKKSGTSSKKTKQYSQ